MKRSAFWAIAAFLLGISVFGIINAVYMTRKNVSLQNSIKDLKARLYEVNSALNKTGQELKDASKALARIKEDKLQSDEKIEFLEARLAKKAEQIREYEKNASQIVAQLKEATDANEALLDNNKRLTKQLFYSELQKTEMEAKLSSVSELKKQIVSLKRRRAVSKRKRPQKKESSSAMDRQIGANLETPIASDTILSGNMGFVIRDGISTLTDMVNIKVKPVEPTGE